MARRELTPRQATFVAAYLRSSNGTQAAIEAGYPADTANRRAHKLLTRCEAVRDAVAAARTEVIARGVVDQEKAIADADSLRSQAIAAGNWMAAVRAQEHRDKLAGLVVEKRDVRAAVATGFKLSISGVRDNE